MLPGVSLHGTGTWSLLFALSFSFPRYPHHFTALIKPSLSFIFFSWEDRCPNTPRCSWKQISVLQICVHPQQKSVVGKALPIFPLQQQQKCWGWLIWWRAAAPYQYLLGLSLPHWISARPTYCSFQAWWAISTRNCFKIRHECGACVCVQLVYACSLASVVTIWDAPKHQESLKLRRLSFLPLLFQCVCS